MAFLNEEVEEALINQKIRGHVTGSESLIPTTAAFHVHTKLTKPPTVKTKVRQVPICVFCENRGHWAEDCIEVTDVKDRTEKIKLASRCFLCLNRGHSLKNYNKKGKVHCSKWWKSHHHSICNAEQTVSNSDNQIDTQSHDFTHLQTSRIWITGPTGLKKLTRCLLVSGSQSRFIHTSLVDKLQLPVVGKRDVIIAPFEFTVHTLHSFRFGQFILHGIWAKTTQTVQAFESAHTYSPHPTIPHDVSILYGTNVWPIPTTPVRILR